MNRPMRALGLLSLGLLLARSIAGAAEGPAPALTPSLDSGLPSGPAVTLMDSYKGALTRSEALANQQELIVQAEERHRQAWGSIAPTVYGFAQYLRQDDSQLSAAQMSSTPANQSTVRLSADQPLFRGFREYAALDLAKASVVYQQEARQWAALQLYQDVSRAFYAVLALQRDRQTLRDELDLYGQRVDDLKQRASIGRSRQTEVLSVQTAQAILKSQIEALHAQLDSAQDILSFLTGSSVGQALTETSQAPEQPDTLDSYLGHLDARPDLRAAQKTVDMARSNIDLAKGGHWPSADLLGNYYFQRPGSSSNIAWDASIALTLPIFQGGVVSSQVRVSESQLKQAELSLALLRRGAEQDLRTAYHNLRSDLRQVGTLLDAFEIAEKNYKAEVHDYNLGLVTNLEVLQALSAYQDTLRALDKARFAALTDYSALDAISARRADLLEGKAP